MNDSRLSVDGAPNDGVGHALASTDQLARYDEAIKALSEFRVPILIDEKNWHERLIVVAFDGTGNNKFTDPEHATNVAKIYDEIEEVSRAGNLQVHAHYIEGPDVPPPSVAVRSESGIYCNCFA